MSQPPEYDQGYRAGYAGQEPQNPFPADTRGRQAWAEGWADGLIALTRPHWTGRQWWEFWKRRPKPVEGRRDG